MATPETKSTAPEAGAPAIDREGAGAAESKGHGRGGRVLVAPAVLALSMAALGGGVYYAVSTRPTIDVDALIEHASGLVEKGAYEKAIEDLNTNVLPVVNAGLGDREDVAAFFTLRARSLYEAAAAAGIAREENFKAVAADYAAARERGATLDPADAVRLGVSFIELGRIDDAIKEARGLPESEADGRRRLVRLAIDECLKEPSRHFEQALGWLVELSQQPGISGEEAAWALARQAELLMGVGRGGEAITKLLREMQLLKQIPPAQEAELSEILGRAYTEQGSLAEAGRQFERVLMLAEPVSAVHSSAMVQLGRIRQTVGQLDEARELFGGVLADAPGSPAYLAALGGHASVLAAQGDDEGAMRNYAELVEKLGTGVKSDLLSADAISRDLMVQYTDRMEAGQTREALRYALLAESLYVGKSMPAEILLALATANRRLADELTGRAGGEEAGAAAELDSVTREEAKRGYLAAGGYFARHASEVVVKEVESAARSRWLAADSYDLAGDVEEAVKAFSAYLQGSSSQDPRRQEAKFRLARVFQSTRDFSTAASLFQDLLNERQASADRAGMIWAGRSIVPLARCYLADEKPENDAEAERELLAVLGGRDFSPQAEEFRDALIELGRYYYESGRYALAIERLQEAETRFPSDPEIERVRFRLADSQRLSAGEIEESLLRAMPQAQREELEKTRERRLREAMALFERVKASIGGAAPEKLGDVERVLLRNSVFYLGDCAYELEDYDRAISFYDAARQEYDSEPASLVALVQIVNAYVHQGEWAKAVTANERARQHLAKFPESVWADPDLPMDKRHWERWLDSRSLLEQHARVGGE